MSRGHLGQRNPADGRLALTFFFAGVNLFTLL